MRVPGDPGEAPIAVPGAVRLALEVGFFGAAVWLLAVCGQPGLAWVLGAVVALHYLLSYDRILRSPGSEGGDRRRPAPGLRHCHARDRIHQMGTQLQRRGIGTGEERSR